ncbi:MAG TPA: ABC transporter ATP-binding protein [Acidimicrobiaceae bacterium]|nr:ABC transporter ATP-binding protein [Acidimicrobiaceae bacterium]
MTSEKDDVSQRDRPSQSAFEILRKGIATTPKLKKGLALTALAAVLSACGQLAIPILIRVAIDRGLQPGQQPRPAFVAISCLVTACIITFVFVLSRLTFLRLVEMTEGTLFDLRIKAFEHVHRLSIAEHNRSRLGTTVARVTSDVEQLAKFFEWGGMSWIINGTLLIGIVIVMTAVSWQLTIVALLAFLPVLPLVKWIQKRQLAAYSMLRTRVGETFGEFSEAISGGQTIRLYGLQKNAKKKLFNAIEIQYKARMKAVRFFAVLFTLGDVFGAVALSSITVAAVTQHQNWELELGQVLAFVFLVTLMTGPIGHLSEILDQTQIALAGWEKILNLLETPIEISEPSNGKTLQAGPVSVHAANLSFAYRNGDNVLQDINVSIPAGIKVAIVGETGSGKTTFAKLLVRLADPSSGSLKLNNVEMRNVDAQSRRRAARMVPQDGFLFNTDVQTNILYGKPSATEAEVVTSVKSLGLEEWVDLLPDGLNTRVGERGELLSVGERQVVALIRAQLADPGLLILDEATSSVDPRTEKALTRALYRLAEGRTTISIAHRLSTAENADLILVFDGGKLVEQGSHTELLGMKKKYANLHASWVGNTRLDR